MNQVRSLLKEIPFLSHLTDEECELFLHHGRISAVKPGQLVDLKKTNAVNIVIDGMFEIETIGERDVVYLSPGSFFGFLPFTQNKIKGNVRALTDARIFIITEEEFYRFFIESHKALRGYLRMISILGFELNAAGSKYREIKSKVVTVYGAGSGIGKSYLASLLSIALATENVILLDLSYRGKTVFDFFNQRLTVPISIKDSESEGTESIINERIVKYSDNLHLLNISYSSRMKTDPDILNAVLLFLSRNYKYIVIDLSDDDNALRNRVFHLSDLIFALTDGRRDNDEMHKNFDSVVNEGQRVYYVRNSFINPEKSNFYGGLILNRCSDPDPANPESMRNFIDQGNMASFTEKITSPGLALVLPSVRMDAILLCSFLCELSKSGKKVDYIYSSSYTFFITALFLLFDDERELKENMKRFFSPEQTARNLDITFPEKFIFKNGRVLKYSTDLAAGKRMEMFHTLPVCSLSSGDNYYMKSTGSLGRIMAASFVSSPEYEPVEINGVDYESGFPALKVKPSVLFRTGMEQIFNITINNKEKLKPVEGAYNEFYSAFLKSEKTEKTSTPVYLEPGRNLILDVSETEYKFDKIFESTLKLSHFLLTKII